MLNRRQMEYLLRRQQQRRRETAANPPPYVEIVNPAIPKKEVPNA